MEQHLSPPPSEIVQQYRFHTCVRQAGEPVVSYVCQLREVARRCNFGEALSEMLRDRLVCGVNDERIQKRLLLEAKLTLDGALKIAQAHEAAEKCSREISAKSQVTVHMVKKSVPGSTVQCFRCGRSDHVADKCPVLTARCFRCQKTGHIRKVCKQQRNSKGRS